MEDIRRELSCDDLLQNKTHTFIMLDTIPVCCYIWDKEFNIVDCNLEAVNLFGILNKQKFLDDFFSFSPKHQPDGQKSVDKIRQLLEEVFISGRLNFEWLHQTHSGELLPTEVTLVKAKSEDGYRITSYIRDLRQNKALLKAKEKLQDMMDAAPLCCNLWNDKFENIECNQEAVNLFGLNSKEEYLKNFDKLSPKYQPDGRLSSEAAVEHIKDAFKTGQTKFEWIHQKYDGELIPAEITLVRVKRENGDFVMGYSRDLREIKASITKTREADARANIMMDATPLCCNFWDKDFNNIDCNQEAVNLFELKDKQEYLDRFNDLSPEYQPDGRLSSEKALEKIKLAFERGRTKFEWMHQKLNGELVPAEITLVRVKRKDGYIVSGYTRDLRELKATVAMLSQLEKLAFVDALTEIYNRRYFMETARKQFSNFEYDGKPLSIIMMDIDKFKNINDTYGHLFGDEVLKRIAAETKKVLRPYDLFARYGGEEFIILVMDSNKELAAKLAWRIRNVIKNTKLTCNGDVLTTVSLGVATKTRTEETLEEVIQRADMALYRAKNNGRNRVEVDEL